MLCTLLYINVLQCEMYSVPSIPMYYNPQCAVYNPIYLHIYNMHCHESADHTPTHNYVYTIINTIYIENAENPVSQDYL